MSAVIKPEFQVNEQFASAPYFPVGKEKVFVKAGTPVARLYFPVGYDFSKKLDFPRNQVKIIYDSWRQSPKSNKARVIQFIGSPEAILAIASQCTDSNFEKNRVLTKKLLASLRQAIKATPVPSVVAETTANADKVVSEVAPVVEPVVVESPVVEEKVTHIYNVKQQLLNSHIAYLGLTAIPGAESHRWNIVNSERYIYFSGSIQECVDWVAAVDFSASFPELVCCPVNFPTVTETPKVKPSVTIADKLNCLTVKQLKELCSEYRLKGYSKLKKAQLIGFVLENCDHVSLVKVCLRKFAVSL
jgi:hypothetical protein